MQTEEPKSLGEMTPTEVVQIVRGAEGRGAKRELARICAACNDEINGLLRAARQKMETN